MQPVSMNAKLLTTKSNQRVFDNIVAQVCGVSTMPQAEKIEVFVY
jgi:hypothetical protein